MTRTPLVTLSLAFLLVAPAAYALTSTAWVAQSDFATGQLSRVALPSRAITCDVEPIGSDPQLRWFGGRIYVINRFGSDNIQVVNPATNATVLQFSVDNGSNPHDIAFASPTKAYVTRYERTELWIVNPATGAFIDAISLAPYADADGIPEMDRLMVVGPLLFVSIQRLDRNAGFQPTDHSLVAVVDTRADTLVDCDPVLPGKQAIRLEMTNPATTFQFDRPTSRLLIGCVGRYGLTDGGVEWVDAAGLASGGAAIRESALGGDVLDVVWTGAAKSYAIVGDASFNTSLVSWSSVSAAPLDTLFAPGGFNLPDADANDRGELYVCHSDFAGPGVHVFSTATDAHLAGPIACTLPPLALAFDTESGQVAGTPAAPASALSLAAPWPNPARAAVDVSLVLPAATTLTLDVYDLAGRHVRRVEEGPHAAGAVHARWDLVDAAGSRVRPGLYVIRATASGRTEARRVVVVQ